MLITFSTDPLKHSVINPDYDEQVGSRASPGYRLWCGNDLVINVVTQAETGD